MTILEFSFQLQTFKVYLFFYWFSSFLEPLQSNFIFYNIINMQSLIVIIYFTSSDFNAG
jgi:hypothetical protein